MSKVYVIVDNPRAPMNFLSAEQYGKIEIIFDHNVSPTFLRRAYPILKEKLKDIKPGDYVIPTGPPSLIALVGHLFLAKLGRLRLLQWDRQTGQYYVVEASDDEEASASSAA